MTGLTLNSVAYGQLVVVRGQGGISASPVYEDWLLVYRALNPNVTWKHL